MDKVYAISSSGKSEKSFLDLRFGKCENIIIYNGATGKYSIFENPYKDSDHSGVKLVKHLQDQGVSVIITGEVGPMVSNLLEKEKLQLVLLQEERIKVEEIINKITKKAG